MQASDEQTDCMPGLNVKREYVHTYQEAFQPCDRKPVAEDLMTLSDTDIASQDRKQAHP